MKVLQYLDNTIANNLLLAQIENKKLRPENNRLTGSMLGQTLQDQILKVIGVPQKNLESYVLRKFERGHHVEKWIMDNMLGLLTSEQILEFAKEKGAITGLSEDGQAQIIYRDCTGHVDGVVNMEAWEEGHLGIIPHEVKSVTNANFKWITRDGAKYGHKLQAGMYAMALNVGHFMIHYVASDDYRILSFLIKTDDIRGEVDAIISEFQEQLYRGRIPEYVAREKWQNNKEYQNYPEWSDLTEAECMEKLQREFPEQYIKLQSFTRGGE